MSNNDPVDSVPLTLRGDDGHDWYVIERRDLDGRRWMEREGPGIVALHTSARFSNNADVEGNASEMLAIADAIEKRGEFSAKRCAVWFDGDRALFESPRNSETPGVVTVADADELAAQIRARLVPKETP